MKHKKTLIISLLIFQVGITNAQIGENLTDIVERFGSAIKEHNNVEIPTKIFIKDDIQIQLTLKKNKVDAAVYSSAFLSDGYKRKPITETQLDKIYKWNNISEDDIVDVKIENYPQLDGVYKKTKDSRLIITHDKNQNLLTIADSKSFFEYLSSKR